MEGVEDVNVSVVEADNATNLTGRDAATAGGILITYSALFAMALGPIFIGSLRSVPYHSAMKVGREPLAFSHCIEVQEEGFAEAGTV